MTTKKMALIPAELTQPIALVEFTDSLFMTMASSAVGGYLERVRLPPALGQFNICMFVNEDGVARHIPINRRASALYPGLIFGDVVLVSTVDIGDRTEYGDLGCNLSTRTVEDLMGQMLVAAGELSSALVNQSRFNF